MPETPTGPAPARVGGDTACCQAYEQAAQLHRRTFMRAAAVGGALSTTVFGDVVRQTAFATPPSAGAGPEAPAAPNVLVVLSLRGGIDGLGVVVPVGDPGYYRARPGIAVPRASALARDAMFGLHPSMRPLVPLWNAGQLAAVHAVGLPMPNRSHFDAMEKIEDADPGSSARIGWVNRMIGLDAPTHVTEAVHVSSGLTPTMLVGTEPTLSTRGLKRLHVAGADSWGPQRYRSLATTWSQTYGALGNAARSASNVSRYHATRLSAPYRPANGAVYPQTIPGRDLAEALMDTAQLIKADIGTQVVSLDFGSWDLHADYGTVGLGSMRNLIAGMAAGLAAFFTDLGPLRSRVTLVTISEFGRRVGQNGNHGLDHGWGNMMLVMGAGVRGGRYYGRWPGLGAGALVDGDLKVTTDYRQVLGEVVNRRFGRSVAGVFPGLGYRPLGIMR